MDNVADTTDTLNPNATLDADGDARADYFDWLAHCDRKEQETEFERDWFETHGAPISEAA